MNVQSPRPALDVSSEIESFLKNLSCFGTGNSKASLSDWMRWCDSPLRRCLQAGSMLEGAPGLGKTLLVKSLSRAMGLSFHRIQFTSDLMPSDITGTQVIGESDDGQRRFTFRPGPVFSNIVLADEVNRAGPKKLNRPFSKQWKSAKSAYWTNLSPA